MKILIDINHPAHVHFFRHFINAAEKRGDLIKITATDKDVATALLDEYRLNYTRLGDYGQTKISKLLNFVAMSWRMFQVAREFQPDVILGLASVRGPIVAALTGTKSINFDDTEHSQIEINLYRPFVTRIYTPECFTRDLGPKQVRYAGYHELAYLHPNRFTPDPTVLDQIGIKPGEKFFVIRFVSWQALHDAGHTGLSATDKTELVNFLATQGRVLITAEGDLPQHLQKYQIKISPTKIHDLLFYATLYIGEGATMASEAAVLGTPAIFVNTLKLDYITEQENRYALVFSELNGDEIKERIQGLLSVPELKSVWQQKRLGMLNDKIDPTDLLIRVTAELKNP